MNISIYMDISTMENIKIPIKFNEQESTVEVPSDSTFGEVLSRSLSKMHLIIYEIERLVLIEKGEDGSETSLFTLGDDDHPYHTVLTTVEQLAKCYIQIVPANREKRDNTYIDRHIAYEQAKADEAMAREMQRQVYYNDGNGSMGGIYNQMLDGLPGRSRGSRIQSLTALRNRLAQLQQAGLPIQFMGQPGAAAPPVPEGAAAPAVPEGESAAAQPVPEGAATSEGGVGATGTGGEGAGVPETFSPPGATGGYRMQMYEFTIPLPPAPPAPPATPSTVPPVLNPSAGVPSSVAQVPPTDVPSVSTQPNINSIFDMLRSANASGGRSFTYTQTFPNNTQFSLTSEIVEDDNDSEMDEEEAIDSDDDVENVPDMAEESLPPPQNPFMVQGSPYSRIMDAVMAFSGIGGGPPPPMTAQPGQNVYQAFVSLLGGGPGGATNPFAESIKVTLTEEEFNSLLTNTFKDIPTPPATTCSICMMDYEPEDKVLTTKCNH